MNFIIVAALPFDGLPEADEQSKKPEVETSGRCFINM
jgi:hypothetical protein